MEIERKFLLNSLPKELDKYTCYHMEQAYISTNPVIRIRRKSTSADDTSYVLTVKSTGMMVRQEYELNIDQTAYDNLITKAEGNVISKDRYIIPLDDGLTLELDIFKGVFDGLVIGEIEFPDEESAKKYTPPKYISEEVTFDNRYHNSNLSSMSAYDISKLLLIFDKRS